MTINKFFISYKYKKLEHVITYIKENLCYGVIVTDKNKAQITKLSQLNRNVRVIDNISLINLIKSISVCKLDMLFIDNSELDTFKKIENLLMKPKKIISNILEIQESFTMSTIDNNTYLYNYIDTDADADAEPTNSLKVFYPIIPDTKGFQDRHWGYYIPIFKGKDFINSCDYMVHAFSFINNLAIVDKIEKADYVLIHPESQLKELRTDKKIIIIDYFDSDGQMRNVLKMDTNYIMEKFKPELYYKRSCIEKSTMNFKKYFCSYNIINYAIKHEYIDHDITFENKDIDIACLFPIGALLNYYNTKINRKTLPGLLKQFSIKYPNFKIFIGRVNNDDISKYAFNKNYFNIIKKSKIIITCNPPNWTGDFRLFEALAGKNLVLVDSMTELENILIHKKHLYYYNSSNFRDIESTILHYLKNNKERELIATESYNFCLNNQQYLHRARNIYNDIKMLKV